MIEVIIILEKRVLEIIKNNLENCIDRDLTPEDSIEEIGINSLAFIDVVVALEEEFDIELDDEDLFFPKGEKLSYIVNMIENAMM